MLYQKLQINQKKDIDADSKITNKEEAKKALGKAELLAAVEAGDLKAGDLLKELENDNNTASNNATTAATEGKTSALPEDLKAKIDEAEKADAARPASEKAQDKADDLAENVDDS